MTSVGSAARSTALSAGSPSVAEGALGCWQAERETAATTMGRVMLRPVHRPLAVATNNPPEDTFGGSTGIAHADGRGCSLEALRPRLSDGFAFVAFPRGGAICAGFFACEVKLCASANRHRDGRHDLPGHVLRARCCCGTSWCVLISPVGDRQHGISKSGRAIASGGPVASNVQA